jgi:formiminotetrahydrofolate cyclodeaminase
LRQPLPSPLVTENAVAYADAVAALDPDGTEGDVSGHRGDRIADTLDEAARILTSIAAASADVAELGSRVATACDESLRPDAVAATLFADSAARAALGLIEANLLVSEGEDRLERARAEATRSATAVDRSQDLPRQ